MTSRSEYGTSKHFPRTCESGIITSLMTESLITEIFKLFESHGFRNNGSVVINLSIQKFKILSDINIFFIKQLKNFFYY